MTGHAIEEVRLTAFKSFRDAVLPLAPLTVLIGRNSSGKSNALDGLEVLSRLARGDDISEAVESRRSASGPVRGGLTGCVPHGSDRFSLGCTVSTEYGPVELDVTIQVEPEVQIIEERLSGPTDSRGHRPLLVSGEPSPGLGEINASWYNGRPGRNPRALFRNTRLLISQTPLRIPGDTDGETDTLFAADAVLTALSSSFHLDPVPHLMRQYVPARDVHLRRTAENLSAAIGGIQRNDPQLFRHLVELLRGLADHDIDRLAVTKSELGDVMLALDEGRLGLTPAREMSDGMLRFLAIATSLLTGDKGLDLGRTSMRFPEDSLMLVIEELENGLHPSQASQVLRLVREAATENNTLVLVTTHSPALLSALSGDDHQGVIVCSRDRETGASRLTRLTELDGYARAMSAGPLGDVVANGRLLETRPGKRDYSEFDRLLGIG
ncbi:ATP-binding protein [Streptomyces sp. MnatMP-M17]|uniref:AAA family ATPase n=1 Tax=unclassified Streptomyces TaxID=2593676 RepID=UPI00081E63B0|nr:ATP-binding protein [Streptomyces sp. MnatMP-M17]MYZ35723.1 AAA family ATPase [Streptomyces sp. SID4917]SCF77885.1 Predicted ATPase [Streptomyces sp. MnatMP-M17]